MSAAPFVEVRQLRRAFDVSRPWLNRVLEGGHPDSLKAVDGVTFDIRKGGWWSDCCRRAQAKS
jgi:peptide/nickel transport system ATP-binding protein